jgi:type I restriction enzyme S subunit
MTDIQKENKSGGKVPNLRFPSFYGDWEVKKLGEVADKITDGTHDTPKPVEDGVPFLTAIHVKDGSIDYENCYYLEQDVHNNIYKRCNPEKGDLLIVNIGAGTATCALNIVNYEFSLKNVALVKPNKSIIDGRFLAQVQRKNSTKIFNQLTSGGAQPFLSLKEIGRLPIKFPSLPEQKKISSFLSLIDERIQTQNKIIEQLETLIKGLSENLFSQKIRFKKFEKKWEVKTLGEILIEINERTINSNQYRVLSSTAKGLFYQSDYFNKEVASKDNAGYKILKINQLVFSPQNLWLGNINVNTTYEIGIVSPSYKVFSFNEKAIVSYCKYFLKSSKMMFEYEQCSEQGASIVRRNLNMDLFLNIPILLPKLEEQIQISSFLTKIDQKIQTEKAILEQLEIQKKYLLQQMFV